MDKRWKEIEAFCQEGQTVHAIKLYRECTEADLKESKEAVEYFMIHGVWSNSPLSNEMAEVMPIDAVLALEGLARQSSTKIQAIKLYREMFAATLKESKEAIEYFARNGDWPDSVQQILYGKRPPDTIKNTLSLPTAASIPTSEPENPVAQQGESFLRSPISSVSKKISRDTQKMLTSFLEYTPQIVAEISVSKQLEMGVLILSSDEFFFCHKKMDQWVLEKKWSFLDVTEHHFTSSFMGGELQIVLQGELIRFSNLSVEESGVFIKDFETLLKTNGVVSKRQDSVSETVPYDDMDRKISTLEINQETQKSNLWLSKVLIVIFIVLATAFLGFLIDIIGISIF